MSSVVQQQRADRGSFERVQAALEQRGCRPRARGDHLDARCPAHEDRRPSLSVDWRTDPQRGGMTVVCCHTGCGGDDVISALSLEWADLFDTDVSPAQQMQNSANTVRPPVVVPRPRELPPRRGWPSGLGDPEAVYAYHSVTGELLYEIGRFRGKEGKTFRGRTPVPSWLGWWRHSLPEDRVLYRLPELAAAGARGEHVYLVEGEKDADALAALGVAATTKPNGAIKHAGEWRDEWTKTLAGAHVILVADRDESGYRHAAAVRDALGDAPASLAIVRTPLGQPKADVSDHLAAGLALAALESVPADLLPAAEASGQVVPGPWTARTTAGGETEPLRITRDEYLADDLALYKLGKVRGSNSRGRREARELLNVRVELTGRVRKDMGDGSRPTVTHVDLCARRSNDRVSLAAVEVKDFEAMTWAHDLPWSDVIFRRTPSGRSDVVNAIVATSGAAVPLTTAYGTLGWRQRPDGSWMYVHAGGAIDAAGMVDGVRVDVPAELHCYALPAPPDDPAEVAAGVQASTALLWDLAARISAPALGAAYRAVLGESNTTLFLLGSKGAGKSGLAAQILQHSAPNVRYNRLPIPAGEDGGTTTWLEEVRYVAGHVPFVADDLAPDRGVDRSATRANILARSQHNRIGKGRARRDGGTRPVHPPRGLLVLTGEEGASSPSAESRILYVPLARGEVLPATLAELETGDQCAARATLTAALIRWAASRMDGMEQWISQTRTEYAATLADPDAEDPGIEARRAEAAADLAVGWRAMLDAVVELGALSSKAAEEMFAYAWLGLAEAKRRQAATATRASLVDRAADVLRSALVSGRAHVAGRAGDAPADQTGVRRWGWTPAAGLLEPKPAGARVGWFEDGTLWLEPGALMAILDAQSRAEGDPLKVTARALAMALADEQVIRTEEASDGTRTAVRVRAAGGRYRAWEVPVSWLFPDDEPTPLVVAPEPPPASPVRETNPEPPSQPATSPAPEMQNSIPDEQVKPEESAATDYRGLALVADADCAWLAAPGKDPEPMPAPPATLPELLAWAESAPLGMHHDYARDDYGQIWLTPAAATRYGLPATRPADEKAAGKLAVVKTLEAAGWQLGRGALAYWWAIAYRPGGRTVRLAIPSWANDGDCPLLADTPTADQLAARLGEYARLVGTAWQISSGVTGLRALELSRTRTTVKVSEPAKPAPPSKRGRPDTPDDFDLLWQRAPEPDEANLAYVHAYDLNGMYLAAAARVRVGLGEAEHRESPEFDRNMPGYWRIPEPPAWQHQRLPNPFDPTSRGRRGALWLTTPRLHVLQELGWWEGEITEAYVWPAIAKGNRHPGARYLEHWADRLIRARAIRAEQLGPEEAGRDPMLKAVKFSYAAAVGRLNKDDLGAHPLYRPDWRHHVMGTATGNLLRKIAAVAEAGCYPLAIATDCVIYASNDPNPETACPAGLPFGYGLGQAKPAGTAVMADALPLLKSAARPDRSKLLDLFEAGED